MVSDRGMICLVFNISQLTMLKVIWVSPQCFLTGIIVAFSSSHSTMAHTLSEGRVTQFSHALPSDSEVTTLYSLCWWKSFPFHGGLHSSSWGPGDWVSVTLRGPVSLEDYTVGPQLFALTWWVSSSRKRESTNLCLPMLEFRQNQLQACKSGLWEMQFKVFSWL